MPNVSKRIFTSEFSCDSRKLYGPLIPKRRGWKQCHCGETQICRSISVKKLPTSNNFGEEALPNEGCP